MGDNPPLEASHTIGDWGAKRYTGRETVRQISYITSAQHEACGFSPVGAPDFAAVTDPTSLNQNRSPEVLKTLDTIDLVGVDEWREYDWGGRMYGATEPLVPSNGHAMSDK
jgi:hypothetical protein